MVLKIMLTWKFIWSNEAAYVEKLIYCIIYEQGFWNFFYCFRKYRNAINALKKGYRLRMASQVDVVTETKEAVSSSRLTVPRMCDPR